MPPPKRSPGDYPVFRLCALTLAGASRIVPSRRRFEWRREWEAEVWTYVHSFAQAGRLTWDRQLDLFLRCLGAIRHAAWLRGRSAAGLARVTLRELAAEPAWAGALILTLGLTLGIAGAVFDLGWVALTLRDPDSVDDRVVRIWNSAPAAEIDRTALSVEEFTRFQHANRTLEHIAAFRRRTVMLGDPAAETTPVKAAIVTGDFFAVFRRPPVLGRTPADQAGVVLGYDLWWTRFHGDPHIVGQPITIDGSGVLVRGVAAADFRFPRGETDLWLLTPSIPSSGAGERGLAAIGLLRHGVQRSTAQRELTGVSLGLQRESPAVYFGQFGATWEVLVDPLSRPGRGYEPILFVLMGASVVAVLAALACVLAMAGHGRTRQGPSTGIAAPMACLSGAAIIAVALGASAMTGAGALFQSWMPALGQRTLGAPGLCFIAGGTVLAAAVIGARRRGFPGEPVSLPPLVQILAVASGVILLSLLAGFGASYGRLHAEGPGFQDADLYAIPSAGRSGDLDRVRARLQRSPGVVAVARATGLPYVDGSASTTFELENPGVRAGHPATSAAVQFVDPDYFGVMGMKLRGGRWLDTASAEVVVSAAMATRFWAAGEALGKRIMLYLPERSVWVTVVGIAGNVRRGTLGGAGIAEMYLPYALGNGGRAPALVVRTAMNADAVADYIRQEVPASRVIRMDTRVQGSEAPHRNATVMLAALALLVVTGGVVSGYHSANGWPESAMAAAVGALVGLGAVWWMSPTLTDVLYRTKILDPGILWAVVLVAAGSPVVAGILPRTFTPAGGRRARPCPL
jgi:hypothetical protein